MNSSGMPLIFSPDGKAASRGFRHSHSQVAMSAVLLCQQLKGEMVVFCHMEYNAGGNSRDTYENYKKEG